MKLSKEQKNDLQELVTSSGWKLVVFHLDARRSQALASLVSAATEEVVRYQERVRALEYLKKIPHELINGGTYEATDERN